MLLIKIHLSQCSEWMVWILVAYGGHWRCTSGSHRTGGKAPLWASEEWTTTMTAGAPVGTALSLSPATRRRAREMACCTPRHRAMPLTAMPGGMGNRRGTGERPRALREAAVCVCPITGHNCLKNNHTTDAQATPTHKAAVITGRKPSVKMVLTVQTAGSHDTHTHIHTQRFMWKQATWGKEMVESSSHQAEY